MSYSANEHPGDDYLIKGSIPCELRQKPDRIDSLSARYNNYILDGAGCLCTILIIVGVCGHGVKERDGETVREERGDGEQHTLRFEISVL